MLRKIDDFLIDKVAQPVADRFEWLGSCYGIAGFLFTGAILAELACVVDGITKDRWNVGALLVAATWMFDVVRAYRIDASARRNVLPVDRVSQLWRRAVWLLLAVAGLPLLIKDELGGERWFDDIGWFICTVGLYFMACRARPPRQKRAAGCLPNGRVAHAR